MGQVYEIPYSALIATLLLKNRVVTFKEINNFEKIVSSWGYNYYVMDDEYVSGMPSTYYIDSFLSNFLVSFNNSFFIRNDLDYNSKIGNKTIREILEETARYPGDMLINYIGYQVVEKKDNKQFNKDIKVLSRVRNLVFNYYNKNNRVRMEFSK